MSNLAGAHGFAGHWATSLDLAEKVLEQAHAVCGPSHPLTTGTMHQLAMNYAGLGRLAESMDLYEKVLKLKSTADPASSISLMLGYAYACQQAGELEQSERLLREALSHNGKRADSVQRKIQAATIRGWLARTLLCKGGIWPPSPSSRKPWQSTKRNSLII
jgi:hypothetical protein